MTTNNSASAQGASEENLSLFRHFLSLKTHPFLSEREPIDTQGFDPPPTHPIASVTALLWSENACCYGGHDPTPPHTHCSRDIFLCELYNTYCCGALFSTPTIVTQKSDYCPDRSTFPSGVVHKLRNAKIANFLPPPPPDDPSLPSHTRTLHISTYPRYAIVAT